MPVTIESTPKAPSLALDLLNRPLYNLERSETYLNGRSGMAYIMPEIKTSIDEDMWDVVNSFQIERHVEEEHSERVFRDWTPVSEITKVIVDVGLHYGLTYNYRIRWRNTSETVGPWSAWQPVTVL